MHRLLEKVEKELDNIGDKGLTSSNLDTTFKLIDIYKDIKESEYYDCKTREGDSYDARRRGSDGRYMSGRDYWDERYHDGDWEARGRYNIDDKYNRYMTRMKEGMEKYTEGRDRYRNNGDSSDRMVDGIDMTMDAICMFVESLADFAETSKEKEIIRKHLNKMKNV